MENGWYESYLSQCYVHVSWTVGGTAATRTHFASSRLGLEPKTGDQSFPIHSALDVHYSSESNGGTHGARPRATSPTGMIILLSRHEKAAAVCRRDGGVIVVHVHHALRGSIPTSQTFAARVFECIRIPLGPVSGQQFSGQSVAWSSPAPARLCTPTAISWRLLYEVKDDMKWMNENMQWHEVKDWNEESVGRMKMGKWENPEKTREIPTFPTTIVPLATPWLEFRTSLTDRRAV